MLIDRIRRGVAVTLAAGVLFGFAMSEATQAQSEPTAAPFTTCSRDLGDKDKYLASLKAEGWVVAADQDAALATLRDGVLAAFAPYRKGMDAVLAYREKQAVAEFADLARDRTLFEQNGAVLLLAGFQKTSGERRINCAIALPNDRLTADAFIEYGAAPARDGIRTLTIFGRKGFGGRDMTISLVQLTPPDGVQPTFAARNGILTRLLIPAPVPDAKP